MEPSADANGVASAAEMKRTERTPRWTELLVFAVTGLYGCLLSVKALEQFGQPWFAWHMGSWVAVVCLAALGLMTLTQARPVLVDNLAAGFLLLVLAVQSSHAILERPDSVQMYAMTGVLFLAQAWVVRGSFSEWARLHLPFSTFFVVLPVFFKVPALVPQPGQWLAPAGWPLVVLGLGIVIAKLNLDRQEILQYAEELKRQIGMESKSLQAKFSSVQHSLQVEYEGLRKRLWETSLLEAREDVRWEMRSRLTTPLLALKMVSSGFASELPEDKRRIMSEAIERLQAMVGEFVPMESITSVETDFFKPAESVSDVSVFPVVQAVFEQNRRETEANRRLRMYFDGSVRQAEALRACVNTGDLITILNHFVSQAVKAVSGQGVIRVGCKAGLRTVLITIEDNGCGLSEERLNRDSRGPSIFSFRHARAIVETWSGRLDIASRLGVGTRVTIELPRIQELPAAAHHPTAPSLEGSVPVAALN